MKKLIFIFILTLMLCFGTVSGEITKGNAKAFRAIAKKAQSANPESSSKKATAPSAPPSLPVAQLPVIEDIREQPRCAEQYTTTTSNKPCCAGMNADNYLGTCSRHPCARAGEDDTLEKPCCRGLLQSYRRGTTQRICISSCTPAYTTPTSERPSCCPGLSASNYLGTCSLPCAREGEEDTLEKPCCRNLQQEYRSGGRAYCVSSTGASSGSANCAEIIPKLNEILSLLRRQ